MSRYAPDTTWWIASNGDQKGPISTSVLDQWIKEGRVTPDSFVRPSCDAPWMLVKDLRLSSDSSAFLGGAAVAAGLILAFETLVLTLTGASYAPWAQGLLGAYVLAALLLAAPRRKAD